MIRFLTLLTPSTLRAMLAAADLSAPDFANPESMTVPFSVSTLMEVPATRVSSSRRALTVVVMTVSSI